MESWNSIINTALLGTEKKALRKEDLEAAIAESFAVIMQQGTDGEETFLQTAALVYNYRQCGVVPLKKDVSPPLAGAEEKIYASPFAHVILNDVTDTGSASLLLFWMRQCAGKNCIVQPDFIPTLLAAAVKDKSLQPSAIEVCGRRGEWLSKFNEEWAWGETVNEEERWQTGSLAQRKTVLAQTRKVAPAKAREMLQHTWPQEPAAAKAELLEEMLTNVSDEDLPWLEEVAKEKSAKVKTAAEKLLSVIPSSMMVQRYQNVLKQSMGLTTSKGILGIGAKTSLEVKLAEVDEAVFKTGIEQISNDKKLSDDVFILQQLIAAVPPHFWEEHFALGKRKIIELFSKEPKHKSFLTALGKAAAAFNDVDWLRELIAAGGDAFYPLALHRLPQKEAEAYATPFLGNDEQAGWVLQQLHAFPEEWGLSFTKAMLRFMAKNPYHYHRGFYNDHAHLLPVAAVAELEKCTPKEEHLRYQWSNLSEHITKLLTLKLQTLKAFNE